MGNVFKNVFGSDPEPVQQPTAFQTLPGFAREGFETAVTGAEGFAAQPGIFGPAPLTPQQQQAIGQLTALPQAFTPEGFQEQLSVFQNPFIESVVGGVQSDVEEALQNQLTDVASLASQQGAFGGTRQATTEAQLRARALEDLSQRTSQLRSQGFESAVNNALRSIGAQGALGGDIFNLGSILQQQQTARQQAPLQGISFLSDIARGVPGGSGQTTFSPGSTGLFGRILEPIAQLAGGVSGAQQGGG